MKNVIAIRREDLSKKGEQRVPVTPVFVAEMVATGHRLLVQPGRHPETLEVKRAHADALFIEAGAKVQEDIREAGIILGLKEIGLEYIYPDKTYCCFSHTHKGQLKNRQMLQTFVDNRTTLIDYELITNAEGVRTVTAFTYFAGYAGMIDTLWAYGQRVKLQGKVHPFSAIPQAIRCENVDEMKSFLKELGADIQANGTPADQPPFINIVLGDGKTSKGAQEIYDILPVRRIRPHQIRETFTSGSRHFVYECVMSIGEMFRPTASASISKATWEGMDAASRRAAYMAHPEQFEGNLDDYLQYASIVLNCILWSSKYPRLITKALMHKVWEGAHALQVIGDISCDPNGAVEFSKDTWIDNPVFIYHPVTEDTTMGMQGEGVAVMAVTNLPCEFSLDSSEQFAKDLGHLLHSLADADYTGTIERSGLDDELKRGTILWKGEFTPKFAYMREYLTVSAEPTHTRR